MTSTSDLCDRFGDRVAVAEPLLRDFGGARRLPATIETVRVFEDNALVRKVLETEGRGRVLVVDGGGSRRCALLGGRLAALAATNGWAGVVVHGCVRDVGGDSAASVGVKALDACPQTARQDRRGRAGRRPHVRGDHLHPGHVLWGDEDGVVVGEPGLRGLETRGARVPKQTARRLRRAV